MKTELVLLIDGSQYRLLESDARWLADAVRRTAVDAAGRAWDREAGAALQVADVIAQGIERGRASNTVELGRSHAHGLLAYAFHDRDAADVYARVAGSEGVAALYLGLRRFSLSSVDRRAAS